MRFMRMLSVGYLLEDHFSLMLMVHPTGFEPVTFASEGGLVEKGLIGLPRRKASTQRV